MNWVASRVRPDSTTERIDASPSWPKPRHTTPFLKRSRAAVGVAQPISDSSNAAPPSAARWAGHQTSTTHGRHPCVHFADVPKLALRLLMRIGLSASEMCDMPIRKITGRLIRSAAHDMF